MRNDRKSYCSEQVDRKWEGIMERNLLVSKKDPSKLENAPINNLAAERHVGSVQTELSIRRPCNLTFANNSNVMAKSIDFIEFKPVDEMNKFHSLDRQDEMGLSIEEAQNRNSDRKRDADFYLLKSKGVPFTKPD
ncbi:unnamed protein product [Lepeophtheirus salmonis]|uniref:(salmon louse) hypothetical protein n=1 Tax=Lepeophtheirus salmonis TaxID=72036 RepID=A0A7R8H8H2_LEPSM|nr:unnamed protein product [Lepeophtheirus salmonis]CAF2922748.1 unnamed protein product [Lepeophtheirus salmonis]